MAFPTDARIHRRDNISVAGRRKFHWMGRGQLRDYRPAIRPVHLSVWDFSADCLRWRDGTQTVHGASERSKGAGVLRTSDSRHRGYCFGRRLAQEGRVIFAPLAVMGGGLLFDLAAYDTGSIIWSFRYFIAVLPLEVFLAGIVLAKNRHSTLRNHQDERLGRAASGATDAGMTQLRKARGWALGVLAVLFALVATGPSIPATAAGMFNPFIGSLEIPVIGYIFHRPLTNAELTDKNHYPHILSMSDYITSLHLPNGDLLVDNAAACIPELLSVVANPDVFVIPNNRDFQRSLDDPLTFHVHYIMVPPTANGANDATVIQYPKLYQNGAGFATKVHQFSAGGLCPAYRLYRVERHPNESN